MIKKAINNMQTNLIIFFETVLICATLSTDCLACGLAYGTSKIKIPLKSALTVSLICALSPCISLLLGKIILPFLSEGTAKYISCGIMLLIGTFKLFEQLIKLFLSKKDEIKLKLFNFNLILKIYKNDTEADLNKDKVLSAKEAISLAAALSVDGIAVGFSAGFGGTNGLVMAAVLFSMSMLSLYVGTLIGKKLIQKTKLNLSWLSGVVLIVIALTKLF